MKSSVFYIFCECNDRRRPGVARVNVRTAPAACSCRWVITLLPLKHSRKMFWIVKCILQHFLHSSTKLKNRRSMYQCCFRFLILEYLILILYFTKMRIGSDKFSNNKNNKSLDVNFISIKSMKWKFGKP